VNEESTVERETEISDSPPVLILPGRLFFVDVIELPPALEHSEVDDFAELSLESLAPFPIEQLYWGFLCREGAGNIILYAAFKERIKAQGYQDLENYLWVLPDFATLHGARFSEKTTLLLQTGEGSSAIVFPEEQGLPEQVIPAPEAGSDKAAPGFEIELETVSVSEQGLPTFHFRAVDAGEEGISGDWKKLSPGEGALWRADVRDADFKRNERNARKLTTWITRATGYAMLLAVLLLVLEGILMLGDLWLDGQKAKVAAQAPEVRRIEDKQSLMNKLDQVAQNELRPIAILEALNQPRPQSVYFTRTDIEEQNRIMIDGIANTIKELNAYTSALSASGRFNLVEDPDTNFRGGKTTFRLELDYIHAEENSAGTRETKEQEAPEA
jgi:Tfp pilus assembly protein PilN